MKQTGLKCDENDWEGMKWIERNQTESDEGGGT